jgi:tetratricopeptide (TPR) repeat protein
MPVPIAGFRVFIASPGGLQSERKAFRRILGEFNDSTALLRGVLFQPVGWEDTLGGAGRPQEIINTELKTCDYFLMILWDRWGSRPHASGKGKFSSGTEEEFHVAKQCCADQTMRGIAIFFKAVGSRQLSDAGEELQKVTKFKKALEESKTYLYNTFDDRESFRELLHKFLNRWLMDHEKRSAGQNRGKDFNPAPVRLASRELTTLSTAPVSGLVGTAQQLADQGHLTDAESTFARAVEAGTDPNALRAYGDFLIRLGRFSQAKSVFERLDSLASNLGEEWKAIACAGLGEILLRRNRLADAEQMFKAAQRIAEDLNLPSIEAEQLTNLGRVSCLRKRSDEARVFLRQAISIFTGIGDSKGLARAQTRLGDVASESDKFDEAEKHYKEAIVRFTDTEDNEGSTVAISNLGLLYLHQDMLRLAEKNIRAGIRRSKLINRPDALAANLANLGLLEIKRRNYSAAQKWLERAMGLFSRLGLSDTSEEVRNWINRLPLPKSQASGNKAADTKTKN